MPPCPMTRQEVTRSPGRTTLERKRPRAEEQTTLRMGGQTQRSSRYALCFHSLLMVISYLFLKENWGRIAQICLPASDSPAFFLEHSKRALDHEHHAPLESLEVVLTSHQNLVLELEGEEANAFMSILQSVSAPIDFRITNNVIQFP